MHYSDMKAKLISVFHDTETWYQTDPDLQKAVQYGRQNTRLYQEGNEPEIPVLGTLEELTIRAEDSLNSIGAAAAADLDRRKLLMGHPSRSFGEGKVIVTDRKTFETAMELIGQYPGKKTAVLNFASATRPGGGVKQGSRAQEESLCRCSTLYPTLDRPYAAVLVRDGHIVMEETDRRESCHDMSAHAAFRALQLYARHYNIDDFSDYTLYTNCEPCFMCCSLIKQYRVGRLVYGTSRMMASSADHSEGSYPVKMVFGTSQWPTRITGGILAARAQQTIDSWALQHLNPISLSPR